MTPRSDNIKAGDLVLYELSREIDEYGVWTTREVLAEVQRITNKRTVITPWFGVGKERRAARTRAVSHGKVRPL